MNRFSIKFVSPLSLKPYHQNVKSHDRANVAKISKVLGKYDFDQPIVVDSDNVIIKGHGRYLAAISLGKGIVPVIVRNDLSPEMVRAARISDNKLFEMGVVDSVLENEEVLDFISSGGEGAFDIFDFSSPDDVDMDPTKSPPRKTSNKVDIEFSGSTEVCPKCGYAFWESKK